jgi:hypothetical protein
VLAPLLRRALVVRARIRIVTIQRLCADALARRADVAGCAGIAVVAARSEKRVGVVLAALKLVARILRATVAVVADNLLVTALALALDAEVPLRTTVPVLAEVRDMELLAPVLGIATAVDTRVEVFTREEEIVFTLFLIVKLEAVRQRYHGALVPNGTYVLVVARRCVADAEPRLTVIAD